MIKTILLLLLLTTPTQAETVRSLCLEIRQVLIEQVRDGIITQEESDDLFQGCIALDLHNQGP